MKKIIILFLMLSATVFGKWEVETSYTTEGGAMTEFVTYDLESQSSSIGIGVNVEGSGFSTVTIVNEDIEIEDSLILIITDNGGNDINCDFNLEDVEDYGIRVPSDRANELTKTLFNGKSAVLKNTDTDEILATFDLSGIKKIMKKHVGSSYWYKHKLND